MSLLRALNYVLVGLAAAMASMAVWDLANWWKWLLTALVVAFLAAGASNAADEAGPR